MVNQTIMEGIETPHAAMQQRIEKLCGESCRADGYTPVGWMDLDVITAIATAAQDGAQSGAFCIKSIKIALYSGDVVEIVQVPDEYSIKIKRINKREKIG